MLSLSENLKRIDGTCRPSRSVTLCDIILLQTRSSKIDVQNRVQSRFKMGKIEVQRSRLHFIPPSKLYRGGGNGKGGFFRGVSRFRYSRGRVDLSWVIQWVDFVCPVLYTTTGMFHLLLRCLQVVSRLCFLRSFPGNTKWFRTVITVHNLCCIITHSFSRSVITRPPVSRVFLRVLESVISDTSPKRGLPPGPGVRYRSIGDPPMTPHRFFLWGPTNDTSPVQVLWGVPTKDTEPRMSPERSGGLTFHKSLCL